MHRHHLIPKHMGGTDEEENLTPPISIEMHAAFHKDLYEELGHPYDYIAWKALSGRVTSEEARIEAAIVGQANSEKYKNRKLKAHLDKVRTKENTSKGGKIASKKLVEWIKNNKELHSNNCRKNGKENGKRLNIPHEYKGEVFESKKALQEKYKMSNEGFYGKLRRGEITRLKKQTLENVDE